MPKALYLAPYQAASNQGSLLMTTQNLGMRFIVNGAHGPLVFDNQQQRLGVRVTDLETKGQLYDLQMSTS